MTGAGHQAEKRELEKSGEFHVIVDEVGGLCVVKKE